MAFHNLIILFGLFFNVFNWPFCSTIGIYEKCNAHTQYVYGSKLIICRSLPTYCCSRSFPASYMGFPFPSAANINANRQSIGNSLLTSSTERHYSEDLWRFLLGGAAKSYRFGIGYLEELLYSNLTRGGLYPRIAHNRVMHMLYMATMPISYVPEVHFNEIIVQDWVHQLLLFTFCVSRSCLLLLISMLMHITDIRQITYLLAAICRQV